LFNSLLVAAKTFRGDLELKMEKIAIDRARERFETGLHPVRLTLA
jgi:hypothetical protein